METSDSDSRSKIETRQFTFAELPDYSEISHFKPEGFKTPEKSFEISSWREAYRIFCQYLLKEKPRHIRALKNLEETFLGRRVMFSNSPLRLTGAYRLSDGFYVELRIPPKSIIHNISRLIQFCRLSLRQFAVSIPVYIEESETSEPEAVEDGQNEVNYQLAESGQPTEEMSQESVSEQSAEPDSSVYKPFRFTLENRIPDLDSATPISLTIGKSSFPISKWRDVLVETARYIVKNEAESFRRYLYKNFGPKWNNSPLFSDKRSDLALAREIDSNLFVETNFNAAECVKKALLFIRYTNIKPSTVKIEYKPKEAVSETAPTQNASAAQPTEQGTEERRSSEQIIKTGGFIFTQSVYLSMFFTGIEIPAQCHKEFLNNLTVELKEGMSTPVTIWFNDVKYSAAINYLTSANPDSTPQIRFTWNSNLPIAIALRKACPESFQVLEFNSHIGNNEAKKDVSDTITISCASNRNEFILLINSQKTNSVLQEETAQSDEKPREFQEIYYKYHSDTISELVKDDSDSTPEESVGQNKAEKQGVDSQSDDQQSVEDEESELQEPTSHVVIPSGSDSARFSLDEPIPDLTYTKPTSIKIDRHLFTISTWREVLTLTVEYLAEYEPLSFNFLKEKFGKKNNHSRQLFSSVPSSLLKPYKINPNVWVEINFSAVDCVKKAIEFLEFCYVKLSTVEIKYKPKETASESTSIPDASAAASDVVQPAEPKVESPATFTKPLDLSMFFTYIVIPTQCHKAFLENLTVELKEGMSEPVTLWFNDVKYKVLINNLSVSSADSASQIRFTWNPNLPIAIALRKACPESFQILERNSYSKADEDKQEISDVVTISCGTKPNEFVLQVNSQKTSDYPEAKQEQTVHQPDALEGESQPDVEQKPAEAERTEDSSFAKPSATQNTLPLEFSRFTLDDPIPDLAFTKPVSITIDNLKQPITKWNEVITLSAEYLSVHEPVLFNSLIEKYGINSVNRPIFARNRSELNQGCRVNSQIWVETKYSSAGCVKKAIQFFDFCNFELSKVQIEYTTSPAETHSVEDAKLEDDPPSDFYNPPEITPELQKFLDVLEKDFPDGIDLKSPTHISRLENAADTSLTRKTLNDLKSILFEKQDGVFVLADRIAEESTVDEMAAFIGSQIKLYGALALSIVREKFQNRLRFVTSNNRDFVNFINWRIRPKIEQPVQATCYGKERDNNICLPKSVTKEQFDERLSLQIKQILKIRDDAVALSEFCQQFPYLNKDLIVFNFENCVDNVFPVLIDDEPYWKPIESLNLFDDFSEVLTNCVTEIEEQGNIATLKSIADELDERYKSELPPSEDDESAFRLTFDLEDDEAFRKVVKYCYSGDVKHIWRPKTRFVPEDAVGTLKLYEDFKEEYPNCGVFHESLFFDFANRKGVTNNYLIFFSWLYPHFIRLDKEHWISIEEFNNNSSFNDEISNIIRQAIIDELGNKPYLSITLISQSISEDLPSISIGNKTYYWNEYMLASVTKHLINDIRIENDNLSQNIVLAQVVPTGAIIDDFLDYVFDNFKKSGFRPSSKDAIFEYLKRNYIRLQMRGKLINRINKLWDNL